MTYEKHLAELALIRSIADAVDVKALKNSRVKRLMLLLIRAVDTDLKRIKKPTAKQVKRCGELIGQFGRETGWEGRTRHTATLVSFCLEIMENSDFKFNPDISQ